MQSIKFYYGILNESSFCGSFFPLYLASGIQLRSYHVLSLCSTMEQPNYWFLDLKILLQNFFLYIIEKFQIIMWSYNSACDLDF